VIIGELPQPSLPRRSGTVVVVDVVVLEVVLDTVIDVDEVVAAADDSGASLDVAADDSTGAGAAAGVGPASPEVDEHADRTTSMTMARWWVGRRITGDVPLRLGRR
jgi:hypothetical protein